MRSLPAAFATRAGFCAVESSGQQVADSGCGFFATLASRWPRQGLLPMGRGLETTPAGRPGDSQSRAGRRPCWKQHRAINPGGHLVRSGTANATDAVCPADGCGPRFRSALSRGMNPSWSQTCPHQGGAAAAAHAGAAVAGLLSRRTREHPIHQVLAATADVPAGTGMIVGNPAGSPCRGHASPTKREQVRAGRYPSDACSLSFASGSRTCARAGLCSHPALLVAGSTCASLQHRRTSSPPGPHPCG